MKSYDCKQCKVAADRSIFLTNLVKKFGFGSKKQTEQATVVSKRLSSARFPTQGSTWDHWIKFTLAEGQEFELLADEALFEVLSEGQTGILSWQRDTMLSFEVTE